MPECHRYGVLKYILYKVWYKKIPIMPKNAKCHRYGVLKYIQNVLHINDINIMCTYRIYIFFVCSNEQQWYDSDIFRSCHPSHFSQNWFCPIHIWRHQVFPRTPLAQGPVALCFYFAWWDLGLAYWPCQIHDVCISGWPWGASKDLQFF